LHVVVVSGFNSAANITIVQVKSKEPIRLSLCEQLHLKMIVYT